MKKLFLSILIFVMILAACGRTGEITVYVDGEPFVVNTNSNTVLHNNIVYEFTVPRGAWLNANVTIVFPNGIQYTSFVLSQQGRNYENYRLVRNLIWAVRQVVEAEGRSAFRVAPFVFLGIVIALSIWEIVSPYVRNMHTRRTRRRQISAVALLVISATLLVILMFL